MLWDPSKDIDMTKPSLKGLAHLLRHRELWPEGFNWRWADCDRCAMGLSQTFWPQMRRRFFFNLFKNSTMDNMIKGFGIGKGEAYQIFYNHPGTPEHVADCVDKVIESRGGNI